MGDADVARAKVDDWLRLAAERVHAGADALTALDRAIGDGDHGINVDRGFGAVVAALEGAATDAVSPDADAVAARLRLCGRTLIASVGGASGPLLGTGLLRAAAAIASADAGASAAARIVLGLEAAGAGIAALGKATTGEKTMLDALAPAAAAARAALEQGGDGVAVARSAAEAAEAGATSTVPMLATKGRAAYLGERSIGHQDPGATSSALLVRALADVLAR
jgi:dihydroxyacetone kinase-like protein